MHRILWAVAVLGLSFTAAADDPPGTPPPGAPAPSTPERSAALGMDALSPLLAHWIESSRDAALAAGVEPLPASVHRALEGYVPEAILDRVRWTVSSGPETSLQRNLFRFGDAPAVTLDYVVVFVDRNDASQDPKLWAHELKHVMQFAEWGVDGFAARYLRDYQAVESEAAEFRWQWMKQTGRVPKPSPAAPAPR